MWTLQLCINPIHSEIVSIRLPLLISKNDVQFVKIFLVNEIRKKSNLLLFWYSEIWSPKLSILEIALVSLENVWRS